MGTNPAFYKPIGDGSARSIGMAQDGVVGQYNRANRSLTHFIENGMAMIVCVLAIGKVFPVPVFVLTCVFVIGRILHQIGLSAGFGPHGVGFLLSILSTLITDQLCVVGALACFDVL